MSAPFLVTDWGSSRLRLELVDDSPRVATLSFQNERGIGALAPGEHRQVFLEALDGLLKNEEATGRLHSRDVLDVYFSGMVTSTLGWYPTPYLRVPVAVSKLVAAMRQESIDGPDGRIAALHLHFVPGVRTGDDVMRGEEIEVFGCLARCAVDDCVVLLPGTHSKWIHCRGGRIVDFVTTPSGDVHAALHRETVLSRTLPERPVAITSALLDFFDRGVDAARDRGPLASLFGVRALAVLEDHALSPTQCSALLSGVLIGGEIAERRRDFTASHILVGGAPDLQELYVRALSRVLDDPKVIVERVPAGESSAVRGVRRLRTGAANSGHDRP